MSKFDEKTFVESFKELNGEKYLYLGYDKGLVKFLCLKHNEINYDTPSHLIKGKRGCKICSKENRSIKNSLTLDEFIEKSQVKHGDKYDYSKVDLFHRDEKGRVIIICPIHGDFPQTPNSHINGRGCPICGCKSAHEKQRKKTEDFIKQAREVHGDKYDYSKTDLEHRDEKGRVCIICHEKDKYGVVHGEFWQTPGHHLDGQGCSKCKYEKLSKDFKFTTETFIERATEIHGDRYDYNKTKYIEYDKNVVIICPIHGEFEQTPDSHLQGCGCQICSNKLSKNENELYDYVVSLVGKTNVIRRDRTVFSNKSEIDIFIPSLNIGIEYNGCRWHSENFGKNKYYHLKKTEEAKKNNIFLIHIFEDEYNDKKDIVYSKIGHLLKCSNKPKIDARNCKIIEITKADAKEFLNKNHIQGFVNSTVYLGAKFNDELVGVMTFLKLKNDSWELNRFATKNDYICRGVGGKLFNYFVRNYDPTEIKSFADRRWTPFNEMNIYTMLGFKLDKILPPDYKYVIDGSFKRIHKFNFRKQILHKKYGFDLSMTENEMAKKLKAYKIWDCGLYKYVWFKETELEAILTD